jgi:hypothetical protein
VNAAEFVVVRAQILDNVGSRALAGKAAAVDSLTVPENTKIED